MTSEIETVAETGSSGWNWLYRVGGAAAMLLMIWHILFGLRLLKIGYLEKKGLFVDKYGSPLTIYTICFIINL